jgi:hypothetical protein
MSAQSIPLGQEVWNKRVRDDKGLDAALDRLGHECKAEVLEAFDKATFRFTSRQADDIRVVLSAGCSAQVADGYLMRSEVLQWIQLRGFKCTSQNYGFSCFPNYVTAMLRMSTPNLF